MAIPSFTVDSAFNYIRSKVTEFYAKKIPLEQDYQDAIILLREAYAQSKLIPESTQLLNDTIRLLNEHSEIEVKLQPIADWLQMPTEYVAALGQTPIQLIGGAAVLITLAITLYAFFDNYQRVKATKDLIAQGLLPPGALLSEPSFMKQFQGLFTSASGLAILVIAGFLIYKAKS